MMSKNQEMLFQKMLIGHYVEKIPENCSKALCYVLQGDGLWERRKNIIGTFVSQVAELEVPGLQSNYVSDWDVKVPLIPIDLLGKTLSFFREINDKHNAEVFLQFFYDTVAKEYILHCPKQRVSMTRVEYENDNMYSDPDKILVLEIHSHNAMDAFFSGTDDGDEKGDRFFGVVGKVDDFFPQMLIRLSIGGRKYDVDIESLFDIGNDMYHARSHPLKWIKNIEKVKVKEVELYSDHLNYQSELNFNTDKGMSEYSESYDHQDVYEKLMERDEQSERDEIDHSFAYDWRRTKF